LSEYGSGDNQFGGVGVHAQSFMFMGVAATATA